MDNPRKKQPARKAPKHAKARRKNTFPILVITLSVIFLLVLSLVILTRMRADVVNEEPAAAPLESETETTDTAPEEETDALTDEAFFGETDEPSADDDTIEQEPEGAIDDDFIDSDPTGEDLSDDGSFDDASLDETVEPDADDGTLEETDLDDIFLSEEATEPETTGAGLQEIGIISDGARADNPKLNYRTKLYSNSEEIGSYTREKPVIMGKDDYADLEGVTTFRGDNLRNNAAYGTVPENARKLKVVWKVKVKGLDSWKGVGWTGQAAIVRWPEETRLLMNIKEGKRQKEGLTEVIYAALDGKIRFLDLEDGKNTRDPISIGAPIKGSVTVDPRGIPLLYCGQGIDTVNGKSVQIGTRIFSLLDQKVLFFLNGRDKLRTRNWYANDAAPLIDKETDTMLQVSENGLFYSIDLNTNYDAASGQLSIDPKIIRYAYKSAVTRRPGMENSLSVYNHYGYFVDNSGLMQCIDLNDMTCKWAFYTGDDTDATTAIEETEDGVWLYTGNEIDLRGNSGKCNLRCLNAMTGEQRWQVDIPVRDKDHGGAFGSPSVGKNSLSDLVFFDVSKTKQGGTLFALDKKTGKTVWSHNLKAYSWSTPLLLYDESGNGYVVIGNSKGALKLLDGKTGKLLDKVSLGTNIEGSAAAFNDMLVIGTRGGAIYGIKIKGDS